MRRLRKVVPCAVAVVVVLLAPLGCVRWEQWQFRDAKGQMLMSMGGYRLIGMGVPRVDPSMQITSATGWGVGWFGLFRFSFDGPYGEN